MLGNFSFGDYFKKEAIRFAWEVSTEIFGFPPDKLWPTVFLDDEEAFEHWTAYCPPEKITRKGEKDNFWSMGETGPCGPCTELYYDRGPKYGNAEKLIEDVAEERYLEFWNLVFMQYNRDEDGEVTALPKPSIDTGAGLERVCELTRGGANVFSSDILQHLILYIEKLSGKSYASSGPELGAAFRVIADHMRTLSFAIADGVQPSNVDRGYVLRKVLRRAVRYGRMLGFERPFLAEVYPALLETMGEDFPELQEAKSRIEEILTAEEEAFLRTLRRGGNLLQQVMEKAAVCGKKISGDDAFKLKDTYGLPLEEILLLAKDASLGVDQERYAELEVEAKERSRSAHKAVKQIAEENLFEEFYQKEGETQFLGYEQLESEAHVTGLVLDEKFVSALSTGDEGWIILDKTPFYAEMGGQVGDTGLLESTIAGFQVTNTISPYKGVIAHAGVVLSGTLSLKDLVTAKIDAFKRQKIACNHTATHLLHWALQQVLGAHVRQAGSVVERERLRFDFSHHKALSSKEICQIEDLVNEKIRTNSAVQTYELTFEAVQERSDIKQFFGDKYGAVVRVVDIDFSKELCGGTHTSQVGNIGYFRIAKEGSIAAGIRRIEAVTGSEAEQLARNPEHLVESLADKLKTKPTLVFERVEGLLEERRALQQELVQFQSQKLLQLSKELLQSQQNVNGCELLTAELELAPPELKSLADMLMEQLKGGILVLGSRYENRCHLLVRVSPSAVEKGVSAKTLIQQIAPIVEGSGGGKPESAQAGGKAPEKIQEALSKVREHLTVFQN